MREWNRKRRESIMSDQSVATIARELAKAMITRARTRLQEDQKTVLLLQTELCAEVAAEIEAKVSRET
jgi:hypothetical protein